MWARGDMKIQIPQKLGLTHKLGLTRLFIKDLRFYS